MSMPHRARIHECTLLNLPGFHGGAFVYVYVEDTSERSRHRESCADDCTGCHNFEPQMSLEIADCNRRIALEFDIDSEEARQNSLHKLDTLATALRLFREALTAEFEQYDRREQKPEPVAV